MKCYKEKELIIFDFENGKRATYNMNTGETIGKMGKPVQSLCSALQGISIEDVLDAFVDQKYANFLSWLMRNKVPQEYKYNYLNGRGEYTPRVKNLGVLFKYANRYHIYADYFLAGIDVEDGIHTPLHDVPKGLLKLCRQQNIKLSNNMIVGYQRMPDMYNVAFQMDFENLEKRQLWDILYALTPESYAYWRGESHQLVWEYRYDFKALLKYIDYLCTFEGLNPNSSLVREIGDYANMMRQISNKYEKYPRYFLSTHKIAARNYNRLKHQFDEQNFQKRRKPEMEMTIKDFIFVYPKTTQDIKDEAVQQNNCVASYIDRVIAGDCHIMFMRHKDAPSKSLVTLEIRNGKVVQARQAYNAPCTAEQLEAITTFENKLRGLNYAKA